MSPGLRTTTLAGILLLSITAFQSEHAIAFGQQWRPMSGLELGPGGAHQRLAPAPAFRPWPATRPSRYRHMRQQPLAPQPRGWQGWRISAGPAPQMRRAANGHVPSGNRPDIGPRHVYPPGAYTDLRQAHGGPRGLPPGQMTGFAGMPPVAAMQRRMPRLGHGFRGAGPRAAAAFRPAIYGHSNSVARVDSGGRDLGRNRPVLPGWATTYRETDHAGSCLWCRGG
jgi:hypothetical protein